MLNFEFSCVLECFVLVNWLRCAISGILGRIGTERVQVVATIDFLFAFQRASKAFVFLNVRLDATKAARVAFKN